MILYQGNDVTLIVLVSISQIVPSSNNNNDYRRRLSPPLQDWHLTPQVRLPSLAPPRPSAPHRTAPHQSAVAVWTHLKGNKRRRQHGSREAAGRGKPTPPVRDTCGDPVDSWPTSPPWTRCSSSRRWLRTTRCGSATLAWLCRPSRASPRRKEEVRTNAVCSSTSRSSSPWHGGPGGQVSFSSIPSKQAALRQRETLRHRFKPVISSNKSINTKKPSFIWVPFPPSHFHASVDCSITKGTFSLKTALCFINGGIFVKSIVWLETFSVL